MVLMKGCCGGESSIYPEAEENKTTINYGGGCCGEGC